MFEFGRELKKFFAGSPGELVMSFLRDEQLSVEELQELQRKIQETQFGELSFITYLTIVFGELVPKRVGQMFPETVARRVARPRGMAVAVFRTAGAYGATMASSYNSRGFVAEVMVDGDQFAVVADRILPEAITSAERVPAWLD